MNLVIKKLFSPLLNITLNAMPRPTQRRSRAFCFTFNNASVTDEELLLSLDCRYIVFGRELAPTTGTPHLQGFIYFTNGKTLRAARTALPGCHVEVAITVDEAIAYCKKEGDFVEKGIKPASQQERGDAEKARWQSAWDFAKAGDIESIPADIRLRQYGSIRRIERDYMRPPALLSSPCGIWIHGPAGTGKTHSVYESYPELYSKNASKWWDGYQGQAVVLLDDIGPTEASWSVRHLKMWSDRYPFIADNKGGSINIRPSKFIVTSQYTIETLFLDVETREALCRRFTVVEKPTRESRIII